MNRHITAKRGKEKPILVKKDPSSPALIVTGRDSIAIKAGTVFKGRSFAKATLVQLRDSLEAGCDYGVIVTDVTVFAEKLNAAPSLAKYIGGFHYAPGGNASARKGGHTTPAINPCSIWDRNFRPACPDPRGMALVTSPAGKFWADIYLTGVNHLADGTSKCGVTIADGSDRPLDPAGGTFAKFDYETAVKVMKHHGKGLLSVEEFFAAAYGVMEKTAHGGDPKTTGLDCERTSKFGLMQATGNMWVWGHDGDPDLPRASVFGGAWLNDDYAGSRYASVDSWPDNSIDNLGARGRSDHLQRN